MQVKIRSVVAGAASYLPVLRKRVCGATGGTVSARYCYSVWLRHLVKTFSLRPFKGIATVAELGPGDSLGIGLSAVLSGVNHYVALDVIQHANVEKNLQIFDQLIDFFRQRADIPGDDEFPLLYPKLTDYQFPRRILSDSSLSISLESNRLTAIRNAITGEQPLDTLPVRIHYVTEWNGERFVDTEKADFVFSQAVLEHVEDIDATYQALYRWMRPGSVMSHTIDFQCHELTRDWNGHWTLSDALWRIVKGTRPYLINRLPYSRHLSALDATGFEVQMQETTSAPALDRARLAARFRSLSESDLTTSGVYLQAIKPS